MVAVLLRRNHHRGPHHGLGVFGHRVASYTNGTASPSSIRITPTSRPLALSVPHSRLWLQASVPPVPGGRDELERDVVKVEEAREVKFCERRLDLSAAHLPDAVIEAVDVLEVEQHLGKVEDARGLALALEPPREVEPEKPRRTRMFGVLDDMLLAPIAAEEVTDHTHRHRDSQAGRIGADLRRQ